MQHSLADHGKCTGCAACVAVCNVAAIRMSANDEGFLYPVVDNRLCVNCGFCERVCPVINSGDRREPLAVYAARAIDKSLRFKSSSGGVFSILGRKVIADGGVVYGAAFDGEEWSVVHKSAENEQELATLRSSKYVQSILGNIFKSVAQQLNAKRKVLFTGTPCQIAGLRNFLTLKGYYPSEQLLLVDIICHAAPSPIAWKNYLQNRCGGRHAKNISFRSKNCGWKKYCVSIGFSDGTCYSRPFRQDPFMRGFLAELFNRPSCHNCPCKELRSGSDITIGDFWGVEKYLPEMDDDLGTSLVLVHNERILPMLQCEELEIKPADFGMACKQNPAILRSTSPHVNRNRFFRHVGKEDFEKLVERLLRPRVSFRKRARSLVGRCLRKLRLRK